MAIPKRSIASIKKEIAQLNTEIAEAEDIIKENNQKISENNKKLEYLELYELFAKIDEVFNKTHASHITKLINALNSYYGSAREYYKYHYKGYRRAHSIENAWKKDKELKEYLDKQLAAIAKVVDDIPKGFLDFKIDYVNLLNFLRHLADETVTKEIEAEKEKK